jgi:hypothetical protein
MKAKLLKMVFSTAVVAGICAMPIASQASLIPLGTGTNYVQDFNTLATHGKSTSLPAGWSLKGLVNVGDFYIADDGSSLNGGLFSYGVNMQDHNRALGINTQANGNSGLFGVEFQNASLGVINRLNISYTGEEWRLGVAGQRNQLQLQYSVNASSLTSGTWINAPSTLSFYTPNLSGVGQHNGTLGANQVPVSGSIGFLNIPAGATFWLRWQEIGPGGKNDIPGDGLAVDNFSLSAVPEASTFAAAFGALGLLGGTLWKRRSAVVNAI